MKDSAEKFDAGMATVLVDELEKNLNEQVIFNRQYAIDKAMEKANVCAGLMDNIKKQDLLNMPEFADNKKRIKKLYKELEMIIIVNQQEVSSKLEQIRKAKNALSGYLKNV